MRILLLLALVVALPAGAAERLRILLTNDDGFDSSGIKAVHKALTEAGHEVYLIAPAEQQSGASASVTSRGVKVTAHANRVWAVHGRPADAVRVGLGNIMLNEPPHLVVSGANFGQNTGRDVNVSGTVGAAITAWHLGVPAIAISVEIKLDEAQKGFPSTAGAFSGAARALVRLIRNMDLKDMTAVLNMNYPARLPLDVRGVRWSELSEHSVFGHRYLKSSDGFYRPQFQSPQKNARAHDAESLVNGFITLTFLDGDLAIPTRRAQRYLDRNLLDASNQPVQRTKRKPVAPKEQRAQIQQPANSTSPGVVKDAEQAAPATLKESQPVNAPIQLPERLSGAGVRAIERAGEVRDETFEEARDETLEEARDETLDETLDETRESPQNAPKSAPDTGAGERAKPDSWLRRMFDPGSWRR